MEEKLREGSLTPHGTIIRGFKKTKIMSKSARPQLSFKAPVRRVLTSVLTVALVATAVGVVSADQYDDRINSLRAQNNNTNGLINDLTSQASSYQDAISQLQAQAGAIQTALSANLEKQAGLQSSIVATQVKVDQQKKYLAEDVKALYLDGQLSTIEQLATSKSLSDYVDKEEYRTRVQNKLDSMIKQLAVLQRELQQQKTELDALVQSQKDQSSQLSYTKAQQQRLLSFNQTQQSQYSQQIQTNNAEIIKLKQQQAAELARKYGSGGGSYGGGSYPWGGAVCIHTGSASGGCPNYDWAVNGSIWNFSTGGYGYRNCTDWVAWRSGGLPGGLGNARDWPSRASARGFTVSSTPRNGSAAVDQSGTYGHVMYVESATDNNITVSDYNRIGDGLYRITTLTKVGEGLYKSPSGVTNRLVFVYF